MITIRIPWLTIIRNTELNNKAGSI
jgi:hypothetical protein